MLILSDVNFLLYYLQFRIDSCKNQIVVTMAIIWIHFELHSNDQIPVRFSWSHLEFLGLI